MHLKDFEEQLQDQKRPKSPDCHRLYSMRRQHDVNPVYLFIGAVEDWETQALCDITRTSLLNPAGIKWVMGFCTNLCN